MRSCSHTTCYALSGQVACGSQGLQALDMLWRLVGTQIHHSLQGVDLLHKRPVVVPGRLAWTTQPASTRCECSSAVHEGGNGKVMRLLLLQVSALRPLSELVLALSWLSIHVLVELADFRVTTAGSR